LFYEQSANQLMTSAVQASCHLPFNRLLLLLHSMSVNWWPLSHVTSTGETQYR